MKRAIPQERLLIYLLLLGLLPLLLVGMHFNSESSRLQELQHELDITYFTALTRQQKQHFNALARRHFQHADHFYLDKYVESLRFLEKETEALQLLIEHEPTLPNRDILKRLEFLTGAQNEVTFTEGVVQTFANIQETTESLVHPVEVDMADVQRLLSYVEGKEIGLFTPGVNRPQLIITDFRLQRKQSAKENEVYQLELKLLKREYL